MAQYNNFARESLNQIMAAILKTKGIRAVLGASESRLVWLGGDELGLLGFVGEKILITASFHAEAFT